MIQRDPRAPTVLVTGSSGLIGSALVPALNTAGFTVRRMDLRDTGENNGDICHPDDVARAIDGCVGVVHLAAVSRVVDGERDPEACWKTNVDGTDTLVRRAVDQPTPPWLMYASSREVYGQPASLPANEDTPRAPVNIYGRSKVAAEDLVHRSGLNHLIVRFSNVYGWTGDHKDRVVPAFARQAAQGSPLRVDGRNHTFDFNHLDDTVRGVVLAALALQAGRALPPIHFVTGVPTTLGQLAELAVSLAGTKAEICEGTPRSYDVADFCGDGARAEQLLGWRPQVPLPTGMLRLIQDFRALSRVGGQG